MKAADEFKDKTTAPSQLWQTDFTYLKSYHDEAEDVIATLEMVLEGRSTRPGSFMPESHIGVATLAN